MRLFRPSAALLTALLSLPAVLQAQTTIHGSVVDQSTGAAVAGASVMVTGTSTGTVTDDAGSFTLEAPGSVASVTVSSIGYVTRTVPVSDARVVLHVRLKPSAVRLPGIQVVSTLSAPSVGVLTQRDLQQTDNLQLSSALNTVPGLFMQSRTPWGGARITIRGYYPSTSGNSPNSNGLGYQVFLNDIPITDAAGVTILDGIDYSSLGDVEVIKGPSSSDYGSYIGGTVRLTTERPAPNQTSFSQQAMGGTYGLLRTNTTFQTATDNSDLTVNYGYQGYDSFRPHSGSIKNYVRASGDFGVNDRQTISTYFAYDRSAEQLAGEIDATPYYERQAVSNPLYLANDAHIDVNDFIAGATDHVRLSNRFTNQTTVYGKGLKSNQPYAHGFTDNNELSYGARSTFGFTSRVGEAFGINGSLGGSFQRSDIMTNGVFIIPAPPYPERPTDQENYAWNASLFTQWSFDMPGQVSVTVGAGLHKNAFAIRNMLNNNQLFDTTSVQERSFPTVFTPRVTVSKGFSDNATVYGSISSGYTPPLLSNVVASDGTVDLSLKPEHAVQYEIGTQGSLFDKRLAGQLELYDIENTNKLVSETSNAITYTTNAGKQRNRGVEVSLSFLAVDNAAQRISRVRPWISYSYTDAEFVSFKSDNNDNVGTVSYSGNAVPRVPRNQVNAGLDIGTNDGWYLSGTYQYVDKVPVTYDNSTYVDGYSLLNAKLGYQGMITRHWKLNVYGGGNNLGNSTYYSFLFVGPNYAGLAQAQDGGTGDGYIIPGPYNASYYGSVGLSYVW